METTRTGNTIGTLACALAILLLGAAYAPAAPLTSATWLDRLCTRLPVY